MAAVPLAFDVAAYETLRDREQLVMESFPLAAMARGVDRKDVDLALTRLHTVNDRTEFVLARYVDGEVVEVPMERPEVEMFRGHVIGDDDSFVFLAFSPHGTHGYIRTNGSTQLVSPGPFGEERTPLVYNMDAIPDGAIQWRDFVCQTHTEGGQPLPQQPIAGDQPIGSDAPCRRVEVAIETDYEFTHDLFGGNAIASGAYVATLLGASSEIFDRDINVEFDVVFVRLWQFEDPWTQNSTSGQLFEFRDYWNANMTNIDRHLAHFISGRNLGGGVAWLNAVCHNTQGYALSANMNGSFPYPFVDNSSQNWDIVVVTHEFGHNFGSPHTHDYCPPVDECYPGNCSSGNGCTNEGTIMGYCHTCPGGLTNVILEFHPTVRQQMLSYLDTVNNCYLGCVPQSSVVHVPADTPSIQEAITVVLPGGEIIVSPGVYTESINAGGKAVHIRSTDGPELTVIDATGQNSSAARFSNGETSQTILEGFTLTGGTGSTVTIGGTSYVVGGGIYAAGSSPQIVNCIITGNSAQFGGGIFLNSASPTVENSIIQENQSTPSSGGGVFAFSGSQPQFLNTQFIGNTATTDGGALSSQGSSPSVINCLFLENEAGGNGGAVRNIQSSSGEFINSAFQHNTAGGTGGAIFNNDSPATSVTGVSFCENEPNDISGAYNNGGGNSFDDVCAMPGDLNGDGVVDVSDLLILLGAWGDCPDSGSCPEDINGDGTVDVSDLLILLGNWG